MVARAIAGALTLPERSVQATLTLLDGGGTVPFIARYRKEATGGLDEVQIRDIADQVERLRKLEDRRRTILQAIDGQGQLTDGLRARIVGCDTLSALEDLYLPFKKKRRTRAQVARERGLGPLAERILAQPPLGTPLREAAQFLGPDVLDPEAALQGARDIVAETVAEDADIRAMARTVFEREGVLQSRVARGVGTERTKFEQYYDHSEPVARIPSHRFLAVRRGEREGVLRVTVEVDTERLHSLILRRIGHAPRSPWAEELDRAARDGLDRLLAPSLANATLAARKEVADEEAIRVFADNLRNLMLASPLGQKAVVGIDPGFRTGCKCAAVGPTGRFLEHVTIYPHTGRTDRAAEELVALVSRHKPDAVAVGSGTAGRETEKFARDALAAAGVKAMVVLVSEAGASVYSASDIARAEHPDLDLTVRGAISIARRLQDPLAELVKIEPRSIGVGQYQHDLAPAQLERKLSDVVETCVNHVGVELNTASAALLRYVAGIGPKLADAIVAQRTVSGPFRSRRELLRVAGLGPRTFEQCAGFLRIRDAENPLDTSAVHPERYTLVERMARDLGVPLRALVGDAQRAGAIAIERYVDHDVGRPTLLDIVAELQKPGRDPRDEFEAPRFREGVTTLDDLAVGMTLEGVVTNVTAFGAFVDVGVHQDGLVHVSELADRFVRDPSEVVRVGQRLTVHVLSVDLERKRISLSARSGAPRPAPDGGRPAPSGPKRRPEPRPEPPRGGFENRPFADLLKNRSKR